MHPLIPRVRVGYVLRGTKNLRRWLQAISTLQYLQTLEEGFLSLSQVKKLAGKIYRGDKEDEFVVTVNTSNAFAVMEETTEVILLFLSNPLGSKGLHRMNPHIFSQWFIKTEKRLLDLNRWSPVALSMRASLQMHLRCASGDYGVPFNFIAGDFAPLQYAEKIRNYRMGYGNEGISYWATRGITRPGFKDQNEFGNYGPSLSTIPMLEQSISQLCQRRRIQRKLVDSKVKLPQPAKPAILNW